MELKNKTVVSDKEFEKASSTKRKRNKLIDEYSYFQACSDIYSILLEYFSSNKDIKTKQETEINACKYAILFLLPATDKRIVECDIAYQSQYYMLWTKTLAFAARRSFKHFFEYMELDVPKKVLAGRGEILKPLIFYLTKITFSRELQYIIASYPPSAGKSVTLTFWSAWLYGVNRNNSIIRMSYSDDLVAGFSRSVREIIINPRYKDVFPEYQQYGDSPFATKEVYNWKLKDSNVPASHLAISRDGQVTGKRANKAIIFDDMTKGAEEATDSAIHQKYYNQWKTEWYNRKDGDNTKFVFAGTMWSPEDILNRVREDREAISELVPSEKFKYVWESKDGSTVVIRVPLLDENDETTCEAVMSTKEARNLRDTTDDFLWACVYQQDPIPAEGLDFADELLNHFEILPVNEDGTPAYSNYSLAVLDTTRRGKDNVSMPICKTDGKIYYMIDCIFKKKAMTELYEEIVAKIEEHHITWLVIENNTDTSLKALLDKILDEKVIFY